MGAAVEQQVGVAVSVGGGHSGCGGGESSLSGSTTDDQPSEETNLLPSAAVDDDCLTPVVDFPLDIVRPVEKLGHGIFGEVERIFYLSAQIQYMHAFSARAFGAFTLLVGRQKGHPAGKN